MLTRIATLDALLDAHAGELGGDLTGYRNHTYRVANLCIALSSDDPQQVEKIAIAAALHDMGIWTDGTFDYLVPSVRLAQDYLASVDRIDWIPEVIAMILQHHKITPYRENSGWLVEPFRRSDWADVSMGVLTFGLPRPFMRALYATWPSAGFHRRLLALEARHLLAHPLNPLPMVRF